ncbi:MAG: ribonuclease E inhibitor RraB [Cypionkella sp.]|uniref:ribonuclease E inhibitor RraB n=1 Tax=Cypionkella sp. TaxID=2811411 RepID=UPI002AB8DD28|nr:ribonuclease E inhibitor RraB [Cypionkella sp.]MDZ4311740.1 ribonuclease E inhibitor RraB [Cypionkella sp.]
MIEPMTYEDLLEQNRDILARHAARHDLNGVRDIEIASRYADWDTARAARSYVVQKYGEQQEVLFRVVSLKYAEDDIVINLAFGLEAVPEAELITRYELMLIDAAEKFGGELPGWEITPK